MNQGLAISSTARLRTGDALIVVDMQRDFLPGGALAVAQSDEILSLVDRYVRLFAERSLPVVFSRDWHPSDHCSFTAQGGSWPPHCVAGTTGAEFAAGLSLPPGAIVISKATRAEHDAYSAFEGTPLAERLLALHVTRVFICGLATDYCVKATADAAIDKGFETMLLIDAMRAVDVHSGDGATALKALCAHGAHRLAIENLS